MKNELELSQMNKVSKAVYYMHEYGVGYVMRKAGRKLGIKALEESTYTSWLRANRPSKKELSQQRHCSFARMPHICIVIDGVEKTEELIDSTVNSVKKQTYADYRLMLQKEPEASGAVARQQAELFVFVKAGVVLRPQFLYEIVKEWNREPESLPDGIYTDEDCLLKGRFVRPYFKPDTDEELILNFQYWGGAVAVSGSWIRQQPEIDLWNNDWYELVLRMYEANAEIRHIPMVLFAKTDVADETSFYRDMTGRAKRYIEDSLARRGIAAQVCEGDVPGFYHVNYTLEQEPMVSIIIPNKDHIEELSTCVNGLVNKNSYKNFEIIIAENNSCEPETFCYYDKMQQEHENIRVVYWKEGFNYSAINNFAVESARGELLLFLNNDTEIINEDCIRELVRCCYRKNAGAAGAMLYYPDDTIQHGGVVIGIGGFAAHALWSLTDRDERYYPYSVTMREFSACTGACLMVKREVFREVEGFDEKLAVALNDIDLCLKIREANQKIIFNPYAKMYHYESKSRGYEDSQEKVERFQKEIAYFRQKWKAQLDEGDPYYNKNQTPHAADYSVEW